MIPAVSRPITATSSPSTLTVPASRRDRISCWGPTTVRADLSQAWIGRGWSLLVLLWAMPATTRGSQGASSVLSGAYVTPVGTSGVRRPSATPCQAPSRQIAQRGPSSVATRAIRTQTTAVMPPSTYSTWPLTKSDAAEARNTRPPTRSATSPHRPAGVRPRTQAVNVSSSTSARVSSVAK